MLVMSLRFFDAPPASPCLEVLESFPGVGMSVTDRPGGFVPAVVASASVDSALLPPGGLYGVRLEFADFNIDRQLPSDGDQPSYIYVSQDRPSGGYDLHSVEQGVTAPYGPPWFLGPLNPVALPQSGPLVMVQSIDEAQWSSSGVLIKSEPQDPLPVEAAGTYQITAYCTAKWDDGTIRPAYAGVLDVYLEPIGGEAAAFWTDFKGCYEAR